MIATYICISMKYRYMLRDREQIFDINLYCWIWTYVNRATILCAVCFI